MFKAIVHLSPLPPPDRVGGHWTWQHRQHRIWAYGTAQTSRFSNSRLFVLADGRLYEPSSSRGMNLAQLIANAYDAQDASLVDRLRGDFAFLIWDPTRNVALCARDHFGVFTIYYSLSPGFLAVASDAYLLRAPVTRSDLNEERIADYLMGVAPPPSSTFFSGVQAIPPAHLLRAKAATTTIEPYWTLPQVPEAHDLTAHSRGLRELLATAVSRRLEHGRRPGIALSGGLDSGAIAAVLPRREGARFPAFTLTFPSAPGSDEWSDVSSYGADTRLALHPIAENELLTLEANPDLLVLPDGPAREPTALVTTALARKASAVGVDMLLNGFDGDGIVGHGYRHLGDLVWQGRLLAWWRAGRAVSKRHDVAIARLALNQVQRMLPRLHREAHRQASVLSPGFRNHVHAFARAKAWLAPRTRWSAQEHRNSLLSPAYPLILSEARHTESRLDMVWARPFLDISVITHCLATPAHWRLHDGWSRWIQRIAFKDLLPPGVCWKARKVHLADAVRFAMLRDDHDAFRAAALCPSSAIKELVDPTVLAAAWRKMTDAGAIDAMRFVWRVALLERWLSASKTNPRRHS